MPTSGIRCHIVKPHWLLPPPRRNCDLLRHPALLYHVRLVVHRYRGADMLGDGVRRHAGLPLVGIVRFDDVVFFVVQGTHCVFQADEMHPLAEWWVGTDGLGADVEGHQFRAGSADAAGEHRCSGGEA